MGTSVYLSLPAAVVNARRDVTTRGGTPVHWRRDVTREAGMVSAYVLISTEPGKIQEVASAVSGVSGVKQAHACWGRPDIFAFVEVGDEKALADTVLTTIQGIPGVQATETHVVVAA
jgi:DNA-binding Lrp family transcriptional regulator